MTCRTHYFFTETQEKTILKADYTVIYHNYATKSNYKITRIKIKELKRKINQVKNPIEKVGFAVDPSKHPSQQKTEKPDWISKKPSKDKDAGAKEVEQ